MVMLTALLAMIGFGLSLVAYVWIVVLAFNNSPGWGVACLLCGLAQLIYVIQYWGECENPVMCWGGGILCLLAGNFFI